MYKILVPVDGSNHSLKALHIACDLAEKYKASIFLLYVIDTRKTARQILDLTISNKFDKNLRSRLEKAAEHPLDPVDKAVLYGAGQAVLQIAATRVKRLGIETQTLPLTDGEPAKDILAAHKLVAASTIVMGSRGVSASETGPFGSVSHQVFAAADCTCISVK